MYIWGYTCPSTGSSKTAAIKSKHRCSIPLPVTTIARVAALTVCPHIHRSISVLPGILRD